MDTKGYIVAGNCLRRYRKDAGLTQTQVAMHMSKSQSYISKIENAKREIGLLDYFYYAHALGYGHAQVSDDILDDLSEAGLDLRVPPRSL